MIRLLCSALPGVIATIIAFTSLCGTLCAQTKKPVCLKDTCGENVYPDSTARLVFTSVKIQGNRKTKPYIILREMAIRPGDTVVIAQLYDKLAQSRDLIYNTNLFSEVELTPLLISPYEMIVDIRVIERWYIYPAPQFRLIDRNFNEWWKTYNADFSRVIYGMRLNLYNVSGRADQLNVVLQNGFTRNLSVLYSAPYSSPNLNEGYSVSAGLIQSRIFPYKTGYNNQLLQYEGKSFDRDIYYASASYRIRKGFFKRHIFSLTLTGQRVVDSLKDSDFNPEYLGEGKARVVYPDLSYLMQHIQVDNVNYPLTGRIYSFMISKRGLGWLGGLNMLSLDLSYRKYLTHPRSFYSCIELFGKLKLPFRQPYINQRALGYNDYYLNGLEYYVIDGVVSALAKYTFSKKLVDFKIPVPFRIKILPYIPLKIYGKTYVNTGFAYNRPELPTQLNNRFLYTGGFGLDLVSLYDLRLGVEFSFNQLGEKGLFLHARGLL